HLKRLLQLRSSVDRALRREEVLRLLKERLEIRVLRGRCRILLAFEGGNRRRCGTCNGRDEEEKREDRLLHQRPHLEKLSGLKNAITRRHRFCAAVNEPKELVSAVSTLSPPTASFP